MKKYTAFIRDNDTHKIRRLNFGATGYQQYRDRTPNLLYKSSDHHDITRRRRYYSRHSGTTNRYRAIQKEKFIHYGYYSPKILSHLYLW